MPPRNNQPWWMYLPLPLSRYRRSIITLPGGVLIPAAEMSFQVAQAEVQRRNKIAKNRPGKHRNGSTLAKMNSTLHHLRGHSRDLTMRSARFHGLIPNTRRKLTPIPEGAANRR